MYVDVLPAYMSVYHTHSWCLWWPEEGVRSPGIWNYRPLCVLGIKHLWSGRAACASNHWAIHPAPAAISPDTPSLGNVSHGQSVRLASILHFWVMILCARAGGCLKFDVVSLRVLTCTLLQVRESETEQAASAQLMFTLLINSSFGFRCLGFSWWFGILFPSKVLL